MTGTTETERPDTTDSQASPVIQAKGLRVTFRQRRLRIRALDGVDFCIREGDVFGLLGPNGAGKSTAMYCFLGLVQPERGEVSVLGTRPEPGCPVFEEIAYLPEEPHYHPYLTVEEAVTYYASLYRRRITGLEVSRALETVGLEKFARLRIAKCSKGMKQKAGIACCLLFVPRILFLDEPTRGLDPIAVRMFRDQLLRMHEQGATIVLNSHILSEVEMICNRAAIMNAGRIAAEGPLRNLMQSSGDTYEVAVDLVDTLPDFVHEIEQTPAATHGVITGDQLEEFVRWCRSRGIRIQYCRIRTESLEDVFVRVVQGSRAS